MFAAKSMGLPLLFLTQLFSKNPCKNYGRICAKTEFNVKGPFMVIQGHAFCGQWKGDKELNNTI